MNVLSLFDGMSCGQLALQKAGIKYENYFASEIDKHAIKVTQKWFPKTVQLGDVAKIKASDLPQIDLLIGGSPCQGFSFAGKQLSFNDPRSALFFEYLRLLRELNPRYFLLENVKMKKQSEAVITEMLKVQPRKINTNLVFPINRDRLYWTNIMEPKSDLLKKDVMRLIVKDDECPATIGTSSSRVFKKTETFGALTRTMFKGIRAAGRPIVAKKYCIGQHIDSLKKDIDYRMLTPNECELLQGVPNDYTAEVSKTQRYIMLGNGWTVDVVAHIFEGLK